MIRGMYSAVSGLRTHQMMIDVTSNNLANVNTVGYKGSRTTFKDQLQQTLYGGAAGGPNTGGTNAAQIGLGVQLGSIDSVMGSGSLQATGNALDVAIQGDGWFRVGSLGAVPGAPAAPVAPSTDRIAGVTGFQESAYTRAGNFIRSNEGFLCTADGQYVLGANAPTEALSADPANTTGRPLFIPANATGVAVANDGRVSYIENGQRITAGFLSLAKFPNNEGLVRVAANKWTASPQAGTPTLGTPSDATKGLGSTVGGTLEMSNVDLAQEFTQMIVGQRGFQANSRVIAVADEMMQDLVNLKR